MNEVTLKFQTGLKTCAIEKGKFCRFVTSRNFGQDSYCKLFDLKLYDKDGWLMRCESCLELDKNEI